MAVKIQIRRDTTSNWSSNNPVLSAGEFGWDTTLKKGKVGDGTTAWNSLSFSIFTQAELDAKAQFSGYTTTATAAGTTTLTSSSTSNQFFTGTTTQTILLPVTSTLTQGTFFTIHNNSTGIVTVQSSGANTILSMPGGTTATFTCILTSGTTAASWDADYTGATSITGTGNLVFSASPTFTGTVTAATVNVTSPTAAGSNGVRQVTMSTSAPTGGNDGDMWLVYT